MQAHFGIMLLLMLLCPSLSAPLHRLVVSMGTIPGRDCTEAVQSLLNQTCQPDLIYVTVGGHRLLGLAAVVPSDALLRLAENSADRIVLHRPNAGEDEGPASKFLFTLRAEKHPDTLILVVDDDCEYPPIYVAAVKAELLARARGSSVGGSGVQLVNNLSRHVIVKGSPHRPCTTQLHYPKQERVLTFGYSLRVGCYLRVDVLQGMFGIGFWRGDVNESRLSNLAHTAPHYLRFSADDLLLATAMESARPVVKRWLVSLPVPRRLAAQASVNALNGHSFTCRGWNGADSKLSKQSKLVVHYQLSLLWLQQTLKAWGHVDMSGVNVTEVKHHCGWK